MNWSTEMTILKHKKHQVGEWKRKIKIDLYHNWYKQLLKDLKQRL